MATTRPFAINTGAPIGGTTQLGNIAIGVSAQDYSQQPGGVIWYMGPDEDPGFIIAYQNVLEPTFWRSSDKTEAAFLITVNNLPARVGQSPFTFAYDATVWLTANGYWTNYIDPDAQTYITAAGFTNTLLIPEISVFYMNLKTTGTYSNFIMMKLYITDSTNNATSLTQMGINAVNPGTYNSTYFNNPTTSYSGMTMNGTTQYGLSNWNSSSSDARWDLNSASIMSYVGLTGGSDVYNFGLRSVIGNNIGLGMVPSTGQLFTGINDSTATLTFASAINNVDGWRAGSRTAANNTKYYVYRTTSQTQTGVLVTGKSNINSPENTYTTNGTTFPSYFNQRLQFMATASGISSADLITIGGIVNTFQGGLDVVFGLTGGTARKRY